MDTEFADLPPTSDPLGGEPSPRSGGPEVSDVEASIPHLSDYFRTVYKRRWIGLSAFSLVLLSVFLYTFLATPKYEARTTLLIESENPNVVAFREVLEQNQATADYYQTQYRILQSRSLAKRTLDATNLWGNDEFDRSKNPGWLARTFPSLFGSARPSADPGAGESATQLRIIDGFLDALTVTPIRNSRIVEVRFASRDPGVAERVANALAKAYVQQSLEFKFQATKEATEFLTGQMAEQRKTLEDSELALQRYREQNDSLSLEDRQNIVVQRLSDLNAAVTKSRTERIQKEALYNQVKAAQGNNAALDAVPAVLSSTFVQQLKGELAELQRQQAQLSDKLGDRHPDMIKVKTQIQNTENKIQAEVAKIVNAVRSEYLAAQEQERAMTAALDQQKSEALALNRRAIDYSVLQRDKTTNQQLYEGLLQRDKETGVSAALKTSNIRIVDPAERPVRPSSPNKLNNLLFGLFGGAVFALGLVFAVDHLDSRIKTPEEIRTALGLSCVGLIPAVGESVGGVPLLISNTDAPSEFLEAIRAVRTGVLFSSASEGSKSIVITSSMPGEGKTLVSTNLAVSLAMAGQRVLLIDGDMRRPTVHERFSLQQEPGLSNVLVGDSRASEAIAQSKVANLWILPAGKIPPNPAELLGSARFHDFLRSLGDHFRWVVIDSPPVMAVTDAAVLANVATGVLFVVGAEMTARGMARVAVSRLRAARGPMFGAILNRVDVRRQAYYYSAYYNRKYQAYYTKSKAS